MAVADVSKVIKKFGWKIFYFREQWDLATERPLQLYSFSLLLMLI